MRLRPFGVGQSAAVLVFAGDDGAPAPQAEAELDRFLADAGVGALVATRERLLCAVVDARDGVDPVGARRAGARGARRGRRQRCAPRRRARRRWARCGAPSTRRAARSRPRRSRTASSPPVASYRDLGAFQLLLSLQDDEALRLYCDSVLGPLEDASGEYGDELIRSLEAFIEQNGQWERAARELYCHRHTLRYRIRRVEQLTGPRPVERARPDRVLAGAASAGAGELMRGGSRADEGRRSDGDQDGRVPRVAHARGRAGAGGARPRGAGPVRRRRGEHDPGRGVQGAGRADPARRAGGVRRGRDGPRREGAAAGGGGDAAARTTCCSPTCTWRPAPS